jgi:HPt (histidine-containing phosphotransfer) domain-containing protein
VLPVAPTEKVGASGTATEVAASILDWSQLEFRYGSRPEFLNKLLGIALESQSESPAQIRAAATIDLPRLAVLAHTLKGTAGFLFAHDLMAKARATEVAARAGAPDVANRAEALASALEAMLEEIRNHRGRQ